MDKSQAIHNFWSSFGLNAYDEQAVPDDATYPYITYTVIFDSIDYIVNLTGSLWYRSTSWAEASLKAHEISEYIGIGGVVLPIDNGYVWITRGNPFAQRLGDDTDNQVKRIYFNINCEYLTDK